MKRWPQKNNQGFTLVEVIASLVILTIILISVYSLLAKTSNTTSTSEDIMDATYVAQTEMEKLYKFAKGNEFTKDLQNIRFPDYVYSPEKQTEQNKYIYTNSTTYSPNYSLELKIYKKQENLTRVVLTVKDKDNIQKSKMETTLEWGDKNENIQPYSKGDYACRSFSWNRDYFNYCNLTFWYYGR